MPSRAGARRILRGRWRDPSRSARVLRRAVSDELRIGTNPSDLAGMLIDDFSQGSKVTLGLECPLTVPVPDEPGELGRARQGEGGRPFTASSSSS